MDQRFIMVNGRLFFALITVIGGAVITARVTPVALYPTLRLYLTAMVVIGIGLDIFGRLKLAKVNSDEHDH